MKYISLLKELIRIPSVSKSEKLTADLLISYVQDQKISHERLADNVICFPDSWDEGKPNLILNSHHDTVRPTASWTYDPYGATEEQGKIIGLGSNDAGGALVGLLSTFEYFREKELAFNLVYIASAEEEISGDNGIRKVLAEIDITPDLAIVGEPTEMKLCIAEKGLLVVDGIARGISSHAARPTGQNAIYSAMKDVSNINEFSFDRESTMLGPTVATVTQIAAGSQHNVIPDKCTFTIDARVNEKYTLKEVYDALQHLCTSSLKARSFKNNPSSIPLSHPLVQEATRLGIELIGSPTLSDQAHFSCPSVKIGPGQSERSHTADEYIYIKEIEKGINGYIRLLSNLKF